VRADNSYPKTEPIPDQPDSLGQVSIIGNDYRHFVVTLKAIRQKVGSQVNIRAFFLEVEYLRYAWSFPWRMRQPHHPSLRLEISVMYGEVGDGV
jgi:hypothetical protein